MTKSEERLMDTPSAEMFDVEKEFTKLFVALSAPIGSIFIIIAFVTSMLV